MLLIIIVLNICLSTAVQLKTNPQIETSSGWIEGDVDVSYYKRPYMKFMGIPYAQPPLGNLRFEPPKPALPWSGVYKALNGSQCIQLNHVPTTPGGEATGVEDCLHLNVYIPRRNTPELYNLHLDVIVHIHGGSFSSGSGITYRPDFIMDREVIFVSLNYRLGVFGFFSTESLHFPGNMALRDQILALTWIQNNIRFFGGNPNSVFITGMSSGAGSVQYLTLSPLARGLFHKAHAMSGSALRLLQTNPWQKARKLGQMFKCNITTKASLGKCLKTIPAMELVEAQRAFRFWLYTPIVPFAAIVDKWSANPVLPKHPIKLLEQKKVIDVPFINSFSSSEGLYPSAEFMYNDTYLPELNRDWCKLSSSVLSLRDIVPDSQLCNITGLIRDYYFQDRDVSIDTMPEVIRMVGSRLYLGDLDIGMRMHSSAIKSPVYSYQYNYLQDMPDYAMMLSNKTYKIGVSHGADLVMMLPFLSYKNATLSQRDEKVMNYLLDMWETFARDGKFNNWTPVSKNFSALINCKHIIENLENDMITMHEIGERKWWESLNIRQTE